MISDNTIQTIRNQLDEEELKILAAEILVKLFSKQAKITVEVTYTADAAIKTDLVADYIVVMDTVLQLYTLV